LFRFHFKRADATTKATKISYFQTTVVGDLGRGRLGRPLLASAFSVNRFFPYKNAYVHYVYFVFRPTPANEPQRNRWRWFLSWFTFRTQPMYNYGVPIYAQLGIIPHSWRNSKTPSTKHYLTNPRIRAHYVLIHRTRHLTYNAKNYAQIFPNVPLQSMVPFLERIKNVPKNNIFQTGLFIIW